MIDFEGKLNRYVSGRTATLSALIEGLEAENLLTGISLRPDTVRPSTDNNLTQNGTENT